MCVYVYSVLCAQVILVRARVFVFSSSNFPSLSLLLVEENRGAGESSSSENFWPFFSACTVCTCGNCVHVWVCVWGIDTLIRRELSYLCRFKILSGSLSIEYRPPVLNVAVQITIEWIIDPPPFYADRSTRSREFVLAKPYPIHRFLYMHVYMLYIIYI